MDLEHTIVQEVMKWALSTEDLKDRYLTTALERLILLNEVRNKHSLSVHTDIYRASEVHSIEMAKSSHGIKDIKLIRFLDQSSLREAKNQYDNCNALTFVVPYGFIIHYWSYVIEKGYSPCINYTDNVGNLRQCKHQGEHHQRTRFSLF